MIALGHISINGLMGMSTFTDDKDIVREEFKKLAAYFAELKAGYFRQNEEFRELSIGMSGDHEIAIEEGSTMVRIGSLIFGKRN